MRDVEQVTKSFSRLTNLKLFLEKDYFNINSYFF